MTDDQAYIQAHTCDWHIHGDRCVVVGGPLVDAAHRFEDITSVLSVRVRLTYVFTRLHSTSSMSQRCSVIAVLCEVRTPTPAVRNNGVKRSL